MKDYSSIAVSCSVKIRRNLMGFNFPSTLSENDGIKVLNKLADTILKLDKEFKIYKIKTLSEVDRNIMQEKGLISSTLVESEDFGATILSGDEEVSIMLNEADHIVETCSQKGLSLIAAYDRLNLIDNEILSKLDIAYDDFFGFLTSNIGQIGTGLEAKINLFLPGLKLTGKIRNIQNEVNNQGLDLQIFNDKNLQDNDYIFTISNIQTIGKRESDYIVKITELAIKICEMEIKARNELLSNNNVDNITDKVFRAWGIATNCYQISEGEAQSLLAELKMGVALDLIRFKEIGQLENLFVDVMPYSLTKISGQKVSVADLNKYRAKFLANILKTKRIK